MPTNTYIGIDLGTAGCRACAIDAQGNILTELNLALPESHISGTQVEQNPQDWWNDVLQLLDTLFANHKLGIQAISVDGTSGTLLLCDRQGITAYPRGNGMWPLAYAALGHSCKSTMSPSSHKQSCFGSSAFTCAILALSCSCSFNKWDRRSIKY